MNRYGIALVATLAVCVTTAPVAAQDPVMALDPTTMMGYAGTVAADAYAKRQLGTRPTARRMARTTVSPEQVVARTSFRPDPAVRNRVYSRAVSQAQRTNQSEAATLRQLLVSGTAHTKAAEYLGRYGMSVNNVVDTTALYLAAAWFASRASDGDPTQAQMKGLRRQVATAMATTPGLLTASNAVKQEVAEVSVVQAVLASALGMQAASNPKSAGPCAPQP